MKKTTLTIAFLLILAGCATTAKYEKVLATWVGSPEPNLIRSWGPPQQVYDAGDGVKYLTYVSSRNVFIPGSSPTYSTQYIGNTAYTNSYGGSPAQNIAMSCKTSFEVKNGIITSWRYEGNDCTSR
jgi:hypothetical protein